MGGLMIVVIGGVALAVLLREQSLMVMWGVAVQLTFAIFLSLVMTMPIVGVVSGKDVAPFYYAVTLLLLCLMFFLGMFVVMKQYMSGVFEIWFPLTVDRLGSVLLGFATGTLATSFLFLVLCMTPLAKFPIATTLAGQHSLDHSTGGPVRLACKLVGHLSFQSEPLCGQWAIRALLNPNQQPRQEASDQEEL